MSSKNFLGIPEQFSAFDTSSVVLLPVPFDGTSTYGKGADKGPAALIEASQHLELYDIETDSEPYKHGIHTAEAVLAKDTEELNNNVEQAVSSLLSKGKFVVMVGGEHSVTYGAVKAFKQRYKNLSVLQLDAHADLMEILEWNRFNHGCVMARCQDSGASVVPVGIRSMDISEKARINPEKTFFAHELRQKAGWINSVVNALGDEVYLTIDLDVFDPSIMPSTGTPEPGGLLWYEVLALVRQVFKTKKVVGCDIVELCPATTNSAPDFLAAKLLYKLLAYKFQ